ncbi:MAG: response regulator, partial [Candidatus Choladocola sp.]|nr:response regulator [Candidatus Choladocola sp.]
PSLILGVLAIAFILVGSSVLVGRFAQYQTDDAVYSLTEFYLEELAERRTDVVTANLRDRKLQMEAAVNGITGEDLKNEVSLREYLSFVQTFNSLDMYAMVDEEGMVYTATSTYAGISRFGFLSEEITETVITVNQAYGNKNMVIIATPVEEVVFQDKRITACFSGIYMENILNSISMQTDENQTYCNIFYRDGRFLTKTEFGDLASQDNILTFLEDSVDFDDGYSSEEIKRNLENGEPGFSSFMNQGHHDYFYYSPITDTDWYLAIFINENIIDKQLESIGENFITVSMVQIAVIIAAMAIVFFVIYRAMKANEIIRYEKLKADEVNRAKQEEAEEKLRLQERLLREEKEKHRYDEMLHVLSADYHSVYYVDLEQNTVIPYRILDSIRETFHLKEGKEVDFDQTYFSYVQHTVIEEERQEMLRIGETDNIRKLLQDQEMFSHLFRIRRNGKILYTQLRMARLGQETDVRYIILGFADVDRQTREEQEKKQALEDALSQAEAANRAKTVFLSNMSHDIRTPMNAIIGFTSLAATHLDQKELVKDYLTKIMTSSNHLLSLINDVLDMSRIESGKVRIDASECHLPDIIHDIRNIIQADIHSKQLVLLIDTVDVVDENIVCDKLRLNQVLLNCVSNAMKFTKPGGTVSIRIVQRGDAPEGYANYDFRIRDTGIGMSPEFMEHLFEPFERERNATVSGIQGTGLGMAITKNIVDMMNGTISVESEVGKGTEVTVSLCFAVCSEAPKEKVIPELKGMHALIADDDFSTCSGVARMLSDIGLRAEWTTSGKEAILRATFAKENGDDFHVYIIDWLMPDMNGVEVVRRIRREIGQETPIIILTAYDWTDIEEEAREAGVTSFCEKPIFLSELRRILLSSAGRPAEVQQETSEEPQISAEGRRVLLVEDVEMNREIAETILKEHGFAVDCAENGLQAVEMVRNSGEQPYDLVLMDIQMPVMDGYEATKAIRKLEDPSLANVLILAVTANAFEEDRKRALEAGMNGHIAKPIRIPVLMKKIAELYEE